MLNLSSDNKLEILKKQNPHLKIINDDLNIAWPDQLFNYKEGLWDAFEIRSGEKNPGHILRSVAHQISILELKLIKRGPNKMS